MRPTTVSALRGNLVVWLVVLAPAVYLFSEVLFADRALVTRDAGHFYYPLLEWTCREWAAGRIPLWNPWEFCGLPVVADASSAVFYPGKLVFLLPAPFAWRYSLYVTGHVVLAAFASWRLARQWGASSTAAGVTALAYAYGGAVLYQYCNVVFLIGAAWLPLALLALDAALARLCWKSAVGLAVILALMILGGDPQAGFHVLLLGLLRLALAWWWGERLGEAPSLGAGAEDETPPRRQVATPAGRDEAAQESRWRTYRPLALAGALFVLATGLSYALAAVQILPSSEIARESERAAYARPRNVLEVASFLAQPPQGGQESSAAAVLGGLFSKPAPTTHHERAYDFSMTPWRWLELLWPNAGGKMLPTSRRWMALIPGDGRIWTPTIYLGLLPFLAGVLALRLGRGDARIRWLSWAVLLSWLGSFGMYGLGWVLNQGYYLATGGDLGLAPGVGGVYWLLVTFVPSYIYFRYPAKLLTLTVLGLAVLAGLSWERLVVRGESPGLRRVLIALASVSLVLGLLTGVGWLWLQLVLARGGKIHAAGDGSLGPFDLAGSLADTSGALFHTLAVCLAALAVWRQAQWKLPQREAAFLLLVAAELTYANAWLVFSAPAELWRTQPQAAEIAKRSRHTDGQVDADLPPRFLRARLAGWWRPLRYATESSPERLQEMAAWERESLFPKYGMLAGVELVESYGSLKASDFDSYFVTSRMLGEAQPDQSRLPAPVALRLLGVEFVVTPADHQLPYAEKIAGEAELAENVALWRLKRTLPRVHIVHQAEVLPPLRDPRLLAAVDARAVEVLVVSSPTGRKVRDFRTTAVIESDRPLPLPIPKELKETPPTPAAAKIVRYEPQRVEIDAKLSAPGVLTLADALAPGWQASYRPREVKGGLPAPAVPLEVFRTNRVLRGVCLPPGDWRVEYVYRPASFYRGAAISGLAWTAVLGLFFAGFWRRRM